MSSRLIGAAGSSAHDAAGEEYAAARGRSCDEKWLLDGGYTISAPVVQVCALTRIRHLVGAAPDSRIWGAEHSYGRLTP